MRRLLPAPAADVDAYDAYRVAAPGPWLRINMVTTVDGAVADEEGVSGSLGGAGDREVFVALRALADGIVSGAGTVRQEGYGAHRVRPALRDRRRADGRDAPAAMVVVSRSLDLDPRARVFAEAVTPTIVLTCAASPADRQRRLREAGAVVVVAGGQEVDLAEGVRRLRADHGLAHLLCEGGPTLNGGLLAAGLVDELCLTLAPTLVGPPDGRRVVAGLPARHRLRLTQVLEDGGELFLRYAVGGGRQNSVSASDSMPRSSS